MHRLSGPPESQLRADSLRSFAFKELHEVTKSHRSILEPGPKGAAHCQVPIKGVA
jgi:hypothetical protein